MRGFHRVGVDASPTTNQVDTDRKPSEKAEPSGRHAGKEDGMLYQFGDCIFDTTRDELCRAGEVINATPQACVVLRYLLEHRDRVVSREEILEQCWPKSYVSEATLTSCLRRVRQAIGQTRTGSTLIKTLHRRGYRFVAEVIELAEDAPAPDAVALPPISALLPDPIAVTEHRHLTVLSCTLSEAERLTQQLDPEDYHDLVQAFRATALEILTSHEGQVAQHVDNGLLVYFGYPQAREDDARQAVRSGLVLVQALGQIVLPGRAAESSVAVGVGVDSGMVLVSSGTGTSDQPALAVGRALTQAIQLGRRVRPGTVVIGAATAQLVAGYFDCKGLSHPARAGQPEPLECRCSPYHQHTAFYPVIEVLQRVLRVGAGNFERLETFLRPYPFPFEESVPLVASLLSLPLPEAHYPPLTWTPQRQRERTFELLSTLFLSQAAALGGVGTGVSARPGEAGTVPSQTCIDAGGRLSVAATADETSVPSADCPGVGRAFPGDSGGAT